MEDIIYTLPINWFEKNVQEIAIELGFQNQSFFGKFFKEQTDMSPSYYRLYSNPNNTFISQLF